MASFRPYTSDELREAAAAYGIDPDFVEAVYEVESSRGTNPQAMKPRTVKRKRDTTIVRGPFQLEDGTTSDIIRENKLGNVNVNDPDVHLDLALRLMQKLQRQYGGDYNKMARAYLGEGTDELGTTSAAYSNKIAAVMDKRKNAGAIDASFTVDSPSGDMGFSMDVADSGGDLFGMPTEPPVSRSGLPRGISWGDMVAANTRRIPNEFAISSDFGNDAPTAALPDDTDLTQLLTRWVDEEMQGKEYANA